VNTFHRRWLLQAGGAVMLPPATRSRAAAADDWRAEWERTITLAKREGAVTVSASSNSSRRDFIVREWSKAFPEISISYQMVSGTRFVPAVVTERRAGKFLWDVWHSGPPSGLEAFRAGLLDPLLPELILPEVKDPSVWGGWEEACYDPERKYLLGLFNDITAPFYNARTLAPEKVERLGLKVLLEPEMKGRIYWMDPRVSGPGGPYIVLLDHVLGADNLRRILTEQEPVFVSSDDEAAAAVVRGRGLMALANRPGESVRKYVAAGLDLDIRPIGNGPDVGYRGTGGGTIGLFNQRPHPNAARLFANWIATRDIGVGLAQAQQLNSARNDVPPIDPRFAAIPGATYVDGQREESNEVLRRWQKELKTLRPK
jgi:iron(III) transport system substrate-binding protein